MSSDSRSHNITPFHWFSEQLVTTVLVTWLNGPSARTRPTSQTGSHSKCPKSSMMLISCEYTYPNTTEKMEITCVPGICWSVCHQMNTVKLFNFQKCINIDWEVLDLRISLYLMNFDSLKGSEQVQFEMLLYKWGPWLEQGFNGWHHYGIIWYCILVWFKTYWGRDKIATIWQTFSNVFLGWKCMNFA